MLLSRAKLGVRQFSSFKRTTKILNFDINSRSKIFCTNNVRHVSTFESMYAKLISLPVVHHIEDTLSSIHDSTGLPWWCTIVLSTGMFRLLLTLPAHVTQQKVMSKRFLMSEEMKEKLLPSLQRATNEHVMKSGWSKEKATKKFRRVAADIHREMVKEYNCHFAKLFLPVFIQIPFWIFNSIAIRNLALCRHSPDRAQISPVEEKFIQMSAEGMWWCPNLSVPDPTLILPLAVGLSFAGAIFISNNKLKQQEVVGPAKVSKLTIFLYSISVLMIPIAYFQPAAVSLYWATSGMMGVIINLILLHPPVRRFVRIPKIPAEMENPYVHLKEKIMTKKFF